MPDPWTILGWILVGLIGGPVVVFALMAVLGIVTLAAGAIARALRGGRDERR